VQRPLQVSLLPIWQHQRRCFRRRTALEQLAENLKKSILDGFPGPATHLARQLLAQRLSAPVGLATAVSPRQAVPGFRGRPAMPHFPKAEVTLSMSATATKPARKKSTLIPLGDRVVVEREASEQKTSGGILLPDSAKDKPARGTIVSVGEGKCDDKGVRHPLQVKPGDRVVFTSYAGEPFKVGDEELLLMREDDILAILG
jgi:chaperonin GroES